MVKIGAFDFIEKPVDPEAFLSLVKRACTLSLKNVDPVRVEDRERIKKSVLTLTSREKQILMWVLSGLSNREIGVRLSLSQRTIESHRASAYKKLNIHTFKQLKGISQYLK